MLLSVWIVKGCFQGEGFFLQRLNMPLVWLIPIYDSFVLISKAINLLLMSVANERLVIVSDSGFGTRNVVRIERSHK